MVTDLDLFGDSLDGSGSTQQRILTAARLLFVAARHAESAGTDDPWGSSLSTRMVETDVKTALWQAVALLPHDVPLAAADDQRDAAGPDELGDCLRLCRAAEAELAEVPLGVAGVVTLAADLHATIGRLVQLAGR